MSFSTQVWVQGMDVKGTERVVYFLYMVKEEVGLLMQVSSVMMGRGPKGDTALHRHDPCWKFCLMLCSNIA